MPLITSIKGVLDGNYIHGIVNRTNSMAGNFGDDILFGKNFNDLMLGNDGRDILYGGGGRDNMNGGQGNDTLYGGSGNDSIAGDLGSDILYGGTGADIFVFNAARSDRTTDTIKDFEAGIDRIGILEDERATRTVVDTGDDVQINFRVNGVISQILIIEDATLAQVQASFNLDL